MSTLVHTHSARVRNDDGVEYTAQIHGEQERPGGVWIGWIEFHPARPGLPVLRTRSETSQPDYAALDYWAGGLQPLYIEGAFGRAKPS